jgi:hypothetical protein
VPTGGGVGRIDEREYGIQMRRDELMEKTVAELRRMARDSGHTGYSGLRKSELVEMLATVSRPRKPDAAARTATGAGKTKPQARQKPASPKRARTPGSRESAGEASGTARRAKSAGQKTAAEDRRARPKGPKKSAAVRLRRAAGPKAKQTTGAPDVERVRGRGLSPRTRRAFSIYRSTGEERIHASKYYLGAGVSPDIDEAFVYPESHGENVIALMVRDPYWLFTYWEFAPDLENELISRIGEEALRSSRLVLRVYDVTGRDIEDPASHHDIDVAPSARDWYVNVTHVGCDYCVDIGLVLPDGSFIVIARSNRVSLPPVGPSEEVDDRWVTLETLDEIYHLTERGPTSGSGGWGSGGWGRG